MCLYVYIYVFHHALLCPLRSDTPLIYKAVPSWFVRVEHMVDKLLENNGKCYWYVLLVNPVWSDLLR